MIYKWFWDVNSKIKQHKKLAPTLIDSPITRSKDEYFSISGTDGKGQSLSREKIVNAVHVRKKEKDLGFIEELTT